MTDVAVRPYHHGNLRAALITAAQKMLRERDVQDLSLRELARAVGVSHGAPRRHFADRQALLDALAEHGFERLGHELRAAVEDAGPTFEDRLAAAGSAYVGFATRQASLLELMFAGKHRPGADSIREAAEAAFATLLDLIEEGQATGRLQAGPPETVGLQAFATLQGIASLANGGMLEDADLEAVARDAVHRMLDGLRPR